MASDPQVKMNFWGRILNRAGWSVSVKAPRRDKCVTCVAPHTSNWDFVLGYLAWLSVGRKANFVMKKAWFVFPLNFFFRSLGGIPVSRQGSGGKLTASLEEKFRTEPYLNLAITPEGTRRGTARWHTGFIRIAYDAHVPVQIGIIDYANKRISVDEEFQPTGNIEADMAAVKKYYTGHKEAAKYPDKFITD